MLSTRAATLTLLELCQLLNAKGGSHCPRPLLQKTIYLLGQLQSARKMTFPSE